MIELLSCAWCDRPFPARRGGSPQRFCCAAHRIAFWSALRSWAERAVAAGEHQECRSRSVHASPRRHLARACRTSLEDPRPLLQRQLSAC
jgi:hypothetical protein